jgi:hypothetical protein
MDLSQFNFTRISNSELLTRFGKLVRTERKITHLILQHIAEIDSRKLHLDEGYPSLYEFLMEVGGYTSSSALRRMSSARLLRDVPEVAFKIESGALNLSQLTQVQQAINTVQKLESRQVNADEKRELLALIENTTQDQSEIILSQKLNLPVVHEEKEKHNADGSVTLTITYNVEEIAVLRQARDLISHTIPDGKWSKALAHLAQKEIKRRTHVNSRNLNFAEKSSKGNIQKENESAGNSNRNAESNKSYNRKAIPQAIKKIVLNRDKCCQYKNKRTGKICGSRRFIQMDHRQSVWADGSNELGNLKVLCAQHNQHKYRLERDGR